MYLISVLIKVQKSRSYDNWWKNRPMDQRNRIWNPERDFYNYANWLLTEVQKQFSGEREPFPCMVPEQLGIHKPKTKNKKKKTSA